MKPSAVSQYQTLMISSELFSMCVWGWIKFYQYTAEFKLHCQSKDRKTAQIATSVCFKKEL